MSTPPPLPDDPDEPAGRPEAVWTFRGYQMRPAEFNAAMVEYYRAEVDRSNTWRSRLDATTNWAVLATAASISFALASPELPHIILILNTVLVTIFLWIEARRYRYYELWAHRTRLMETDFFAAMLVPPFAPSPEWAESLAESLLAPDFPISMWEAFGRRFRRNYSWIFIILGLTWTLKTYLHPFPAATLDAYMARLAVGALPGWAFLILGGLFNLVLFIIGFLTAGLTQATGEVLPQAGGKLPVVGSLLRAMEARDPEAAPSDAPAEERGFRRRKPLLALIISARPDAIASRVLKEMRRGATGLHGRGMYAKQEREVLLVAVTITEMARLKSIVRAEDLNAFVIVAPAQEIFGRGFQPLEPAAG